MNKKFAIALIVCATLSVIATTIAQTKPASPRAQTFAIIYEPGPNWVNGRSIFEQDLSDHAQFMKKLLDEGKLQLGGPFSDSTGGMAIINAPDADAARKIMESDPAVVSGIFTAKVHPWYIVFRTGGK